MSRAEAALYSSARKKKEAAKLLEEIACVFPRMSATLVVRGERRDAKPYIDGAAVGVAYAAMLLNGEDDIEGALYKVSTIAGYSAILPNPTGEESPLDIEMLFNYAIENPTEIERLFANPVK